MTSPCVPLLAPAAAAASVLMSATRSPTEQPFLKVVEECRQFIDELAALPRAEVDNMVLCKIMCCCTQSPAVSAGGSDLRQHCVHETLTAADQALGWQSRYKSEISYDMTATGERERNVPRPLMHRDARGADTTRPSTYWQGRARREIDDYRSGGGQVRRPDVVIVNDPTAPPTRENISRVVEMKFKGDVLDDEQRLAYIKIAGDRRKLDVLAEAPMPDATRTCNCPERKRRPVDLPVVAPQRAPQPVTENARQVDWQAVGQVAVWGTATAVAAVATIAAVLSPFDGPAGDIAAGTATVGAATRTTAAFARIFRTVAPAW